VDLQPVVSTQGLTKPTLIKALSTTISTPITSIGQAVVPALQSPTDTVDKCHCSGMPLIIPFSHNLFVGNKIQDFAKRNNIALPRSGNLEYNSRIDTWQSNIHYRGVSSLTNNLEHWNIVFQFQCTALLGAVEIGSKVWRFSVHVSQRDTITNEQKKTLIVMAFLPDRICSYGKEFKLKMSVDTQMAVGTVDPSSTIYEMIIRDTLGLFKTTEWINNPMFFVDMSRTMIPDTVPRYKLTIG
jgi:hypothetical protein